MSSNDEGGRDRKHHEVGPESDRSGRADTDRTGTARRAGEAAGQPGDETTRGDAERAYEESLGNRAPRRDPDDDAPGS